MLKQNLAVTFVTFLVSMLEKESFVQTVVVRNVGEICTLSTNQSVCSDTCQSTSVWDNFLTSPLPSCRKGYCVDQSSSTSAVEVLKTFGSPCDIDEECHTAYCDSTTAKCSCSSSLQFIASWEVESTNATNLLYRESCINVSVEAPVASVGESCEHRPCYSNSACLSCPEYWNSTVILPVCRELNTSNDSQCNCGYRASCVSDGTGAKRCVCPSGYLLHKNGNDCYGWKTVTVGSCRVQCGKGSRQINQTCDLPASDTNSTLQCAETLRKTDETCDNGVRCPFSNDYLKYAIDMCFKTSVITEDIFLSYTSPNLKNAIATALSESCLGNETFSLCCPGKNWSSSVNGSYIDDSGVVLVNPYYKQQDGTFCFGLMVQVNMTNDLCQSATASLARKKRQTDSLVTLDQVSLQQLASANELLEAINSEVQSADPGASTISSNDIFLVTTTTTASVISTTSVANQVTNAEATQSSVTTTLPVDSSYITIGGTQVKKWVLAVSISLSLLYAGGLAGILIYCERKQKKYQTVVHTEITKCRAANDHSCSSTEKLSAGEKTLPMTSPRRQINFSTVGNAIHHDGMVGEPVQRLAPVSVANVVGEMNNIPILTMPPQSEVHRVNSFAAWPDDNNIIINRDSVAYHQRLAPSISAPLVTNGMNLRMMPPGVIRMNTNITAWPDDNAQARDGSYDRQSQTTCLLSPYGYRPPNATAFPY